MMMFTCGIKKIKGAAHKNGDVDGMCKRPLIYSIGINVCAVWTLLHSIIKHTFIGVCAAECEHTIKFSYGLFTWLNAIVDTLEIALKNLSFLSIAISTFSHSKKIAM